MTLDDIFLPGEKLSSVFDSYIFREDQLEMSNLVEKGFEEGKNIVVEAGTGIGKSFAYLAPAFLLLERDRSKKVVVATSTITLEKQLYDKDIPIMQKATGIELNTAILFGRSNYLCLRKYEDAFEARKLLSLDPSSPEAILDSWVRTTESGAQIDFPDGRIFSITKELMCDDKDCLGRKCHLRDKCFFFNARKKAHMANLVVTNHHILLYDAKSRSERGEDFSEDLILPGYTHAIIDEAHHIEAEATEILSSSFSDAECSYVLDELAKKRSAYSLSIIDYMSAYEKEDCKGISKRIKEDIGHIRTLLSSYNKKLNVVFSRFVHERSFLCTKEFYDSFRADIREGEAVSAELEKLVFALNRGYENTEENSVQYEALSRYSCTLQGLSDTLRSWIRFTDFSSWISYVNELDTAEYEVRIAPMSTGPILARVLLSHLESTLYCSATLSVANRFDYFASSSGLKDSKPCLEGIYQSPFNYGRCLMYLMPLDGRAFNPRNVEEYHEYVAKAVQSAIEASGGGALILFTSNSMLKAVTEKVRERIDKSLRILSQGDRIAKSTLLKRFKEDEDSSLFATSSFWEGVDAPGNTLRLVVIVKLPFSVPTDPIEAARRNFIDSQENGSSFISVTVPEATIKLKQGIGRLIRNEEDKGVVLILDNRILSKGYGRMMRDSLPNGYCPEDALLENIPGKIESFLY